ncbi:MAG: NTP transferase domain-containing protein [Ruminococcus sp.]|nr:NTP transferase domain-containing protein [Ruminococcus sp.]
MGQVGAVITAAGMGARDGAKKALEHIDGLTMAERVITTFQRAGIKEIVIVTGHQTEEMKKVLRGKGVVFLENESYYAAQMLDSAKIGLDYLRKRCERILVTPVDVPFFSVETVERLVNCTKQVVVPSYQMRSGHPIMIHRNLIPAVLAYTGEGGLKGCLQSLKEKIYYVNVEDEGIRVDSADEEKMLQIAEKNQNEMMHVDVKVQLVNRKAFFGPGMIILLKQIQSLGSVREASEKSGFSYSKAWSMLRTAEEEYGKELVARQTGGKYGGEARVTAEGLELIRRYEALEKEVQSFADERFKEFFW